MTPQDKKVLKFITLMQTMYEMTNDIVVKDTFFDTKIIRQRCTDLMLSMKKQIWRIYRGEKDGIWKVDDFVREEDWDKAVEQHADSVNQMNKLYDIGIELSEMDPIKAEGFRIQLNILLKTYGINIEE